MNKINNNKNNYKFIKEIQLIYKNYNKTILKVNIFINLLKTYIRNNRINLNSHIIHLLKNKRIKYNKTYLIFHFIKNKDLLEKP